MSTTRLNSKFMETALSGMAPIGCFYSYVEGMPQRKSLDIGGIRSFGFMISKFNDQGETENNLRTGRFELSVRGVFAAS